MSNKASAQIIAEITENLLNKIDEVEQRNAGILNFLNTVIPGLKSGEITLDRIEILENGDLRILPPPPLETPPNGKVTESVPLTGLKEDAEAKLEAVKNDH